MCPPNPSCLKKIWTAPAHCLMYGYMNTPNTACFKDVKFALCQHFHCGYGTCQRGVSRRHGSFTVSVCTVSNVLTKLWMFEGTLVCSLSAFTLWLVYMPKDVIQWDMDHYLSVSVLWSHCTPSHPKYGFHIWPHSQASLLWCQAPMSQIIYKFIIHIW